MIKILVKTLNNYVMIKVKNARFYKGIDCIGAQN